MQRNLFWTKYLIFKCILCTRSVCARDNKLLHPLIPKNIIICIRHYIGLRAICRALLLHRTIGRIGFGFMWMKMISWSLSPKSNKSTDSLDNWITGCLTITVPHSCLHAFIWFMHVWMQIHVKIFYSLFPNFNHAFTHLIVSRKYDAFNIITNHFPPYQTKYEGFILNILNISYK